MPLNTPECESPTLAVHAEGDGLDESVFIRADWPAPAHVQAWVTTRAGGVSVAPFASLNVGHHVDDHASAVAHNRRRLRDFCHARGSRGELQWLTQVHGTVVHQPEAALYPPDAVSSPELGPEADASSTSAAGMALVVMTADCLPVFFTDTQGERVAVAHAGWRGLCQGVLEATVATFRSDQRVMAWLGPAIGPASFEVGEMVREAFMQAVSLPENVTERAATQAAFIATTPGHYLADLYALARLRLQRVGVVAVYGGGFDTVRESSRFFSYRREARTGRMASVIWRQAATDMPT